jgi:hypothetical protein
LEVLWECGGQNGGDFGRKIRRNYHEAAPS